ncbi:hypothetical protein SAY86_028363 [Trapa natans]|uniref:Uncharacterized protein n=1 Tax=Trapa natans TaxID=22666 RepID=A0AAN7RAN8_TRANT|nr:hypothetical protein SAY86_028363 [Trapa natans]
MSTASYRALGISLCILILNLLQVALGECICDEESFHRGNALALRYKTGAIASILVAGAIGVCIPMLGNVVPSLGHQSDVFFVVKAFAAGVILSTGFIHVFPDANESLTSPCLTSDVWSNFPFAGFVAMMAAIITLQIDMFATSYYTGRHYKNASSEAADRISGDKEACGAPHGDLFHPHMHAVNGNSHPHNPSTTGGLSSESDLLRHRVISQVLEVGIIAHSVIIGMSLGASEDPKTIRPLLGALSFHQFFEGMGLGGCIAQAKFKATSVAVMVMFFSLTTPVGIAVGIGVSTVYDENSPTALIVEGILNAASAGILIYMALVDLCAADFMSPKMQKSGRLRLLWSASLFLGAGCMSLLAKWA